MPTFQAREPLYRMPDGSFSTSPEGAERQVYGVGAIVTEPMQRRYGIVNPDQPQPAGEAEAAEDAATAHETTEESPAPEPPKRAATRKRSRR